MGRNLRAKYLIETNYELDKATETLAGEQSSGTFVQIPGETRAHKDRFAAHVEDIQVIGESSHPSLPGAGSRSAMPYQRAIVELSWPFENVGSNLSNLCATVAGNLFELKPFSALKLLDVQIPEEFTQRYAGPKFGIEGTRALSGVFGRPIIGTIIKPSVGLTAEETAERVKIFIDAGLDFIKDDELMGDSPNSPFERRVDLVMDEINRYADQHGKKPMFAFNISGDLDDMRRRHDYVLAKSGSCIMLSLNWVGITGTLAMHEHTQLPIHGHRNGWGLYSRSPHIGIEFTAYQKFWRMAGVDHIHTNGLRNKFCESDESVLSSVRACLEPIHGGYPIMPVLSSGQWAGQVVDTYEAIKSVDLMYLCGGGIVGHPAGIEAGVRSLLQAWEAALQGMSLAESARLHSELRQAMEFFGNG